MATHYCFVDRLKGPIRHLTGKLANDQRPRMKPDAVFATVHTEDFASCVGDEFFANQYYKTIENTQKQPFNGMINIQMLGDYNLECYNPNKDITMINFPLDYHNLKKLY